jgi:hypothetical protein
LFLAYRTAISSDVREVRGQWNPETFAGAQLTRTLDKRLSIPPRRYQSRTGFTMPRCRTGVRGRKLAPRK